MTELNYTVLGPKGILIQLFPLQDSATSPSGVLVPSYENFITEGGKPASTLSLERFSCIGTVLQISPTAADYLLKESIDLSVSDVVGIHSTYKNQSNWFISPDKARLPVQDWDGLLLVSPQMLSFKINK